MFIEDENNYMFRPNPAIIRFTSKGYQRVVKTMRLCKDGEISSSGFKYAVTENVAGWATFSIITHLNPDDKISPSLHNRIVVTILW